MKKKIKIGIPRSMFYYKYGVLWKYFFTSLGCNVVLSPETNNKIVNLGINSSSQSLCIPMKIYLGHIKYLENISDYILIPITSSYNSKNFICHELTSIYDITIEAIPKNRIIKYNMISLEVFEYIKMGLKFTKNIPKIIISYLMGKYKQQKYDLQKENTQKNLLTKPNKKILIVSNFYNIEDIYIMNNIIKHLKNNDIIPIFSNRLNKRIALFYGLFFPYKIPYNSLKESIGSYYYYKHQICGVIYIKSCPCEMNSILRIPNIQIPLININIDDNNKIIETKIEALLNIIEKSSNEFF